MSHMQQRTCLWTLAILLVLWVGALAVGEQWGRAEQFQPWGVQSPMQRQGPAAEVIISLNMAMCILFVHAHLSLSFLSDILCQTSVLLGCI